MNLEIFQPIVRQIMEDLFNVMQLKETAQKHENLGKTTCAYVCSGITLLMFYRLEALSIQGVERRLCTYLS